MASTIRKERKIGPAPQADLRSADGKVVRKIELAAEVFSLEPNVALMHQVVTAQLAARRAGTQSTKTRAEVRGGGAKPWRQKGTGRARAGSLRAPHFTGGGVALGPKPRSYEQKTPRKMIRQALHSALSDRANESKVVVVDRWDFDSPKTSFAKAALSALNIDGSVLLVLSDDDEKVYLSFRNLTRVHVVHERELNAYDVLRHDYVVFTEATLPGATDDGAAQ